MHACGLMAVGYVLSDGSCRADTRHNADGKQHKAKVLAERPRLWVVSETMHIVRVRITLLVAP